MRSALHRVHVGVREKGIAVNIDLAAWTKRYPRTRLIDRDAFLLDASRGRDVLHLGATDSPFTDDGLRAGTLLHTRLRAVCGRLRGIDSDANAVARIREVTGVDDIVTWDLSHSTPLDVPAAEVVLCADIIEHVDSPGALLEHCRRFCAVGGSLVLTTINALSLRAVLRAFARREAVHPDHVAYFSLATLGVLLKRHGFRVTDAAYFSYASHRPGLGAAFRALGSIAPATSDGIAVVATRIP